MLSASPPSPAPPNNTIKMGWPWSSEAPAAPTAAGKEKSALIPPQSTATDAVDPTPSKPLSRDELAEQELQSFLKELDAEVQPSSSSSTKYNRIPRSFPSSTPTTSTPKTAQPQSHPTGHEPLSEQLLPTTMSCRTAFDAAFYCNSFGGRFNDLYRYGNLRSCSESWNDFWFCMRTRTFSSPQKEEAIKDHYRKKEEAKYGRGRGSGKDSSEDIWRSREKKMEWGEAFNKEFEEFEGSDEEWRKVQREWRAKERRVDGSMGE